MRISCPPHKNACYYGIDFPDPEKLLANQCTLEEIRKYLGADSIGYLSIEGMIKATGRPGSGFCTACFSGDYSVPFDASFDKLVAEKAPAAAVFWKRRTGARSLGSARILSPISELRSSNPDYETCESKGLRPRRRGC